MPRHSSVEAPGRPSWIKQKGYHNDQNQPAGEILNFESWWPPAATRLVRPSPSKRIAGAALDVYWNKPYWNEPSVAGEPWVPEALCKLDNVILVPHNGNATWNLSGRRTAAVARTSSR
jgi:hypothetical protein